MPLYAAAMDLKLAMPARPDTFTPGAIAAVDAMRDRGRTAAEVEIATLHGHPKAHGGRPPAALVRVKRLAEAAGFTVTVYESRTGHALQGRRGDDGFRATWQWGKTTGATWHERTPRWTLVADTRPVGINTRDHVGLKGKRSPGMGTTRLALLAAPWGIPINITELEKRLAS